MVHLLDVNVLLALCDPRHLHHDAAHGWFKKLGTDGWATCPVTENGFIRIASHPKYPNRPGSPSLVAGILQEFCLNPQHEFWPDSLSLLDGSIFSHAALLAHSQITDVYLLGLAVQNKGKLATFDQDIAVAAVTGGKQALELIKA